MNEIIKMLAATFAVIGQEASDIQIQTVASDLQTYSLPAIAEALTRCRKELRGKMALVDILQRITGEHPGNEEAWGIMHKAHNNETVSLCATQPMLTAYGACVGLDDIAARMTFKEVYQREVSIARAQGELPHWFASYGTDPTDRDRVQKEAASLNLLVNQSRCALTAQQQKQIER